MHVDGTDPYPWPYDGDLSPSRLALVLAGWDVGWATRASAVDDPAPARLAAALHDRGVPVLTVQHGGQAALPLDVPHRTVGAHGVDGFHGGPLDDVLRAAGRTHLLVGGHGLEGPVHSTLRSANDRGYECLLVVDACTALVDDLVAGARSTVTMSGGIFGALGSAAAVLAALRPAPASAPDAQEPT